MNLISLIVIDISKPKIANKTVLTMCYAHHQFIKKAIKNKVIRYHYCYRYRHIEIH